MFRIVHGNARLFNSRIILRNKSEGKVLTYFGGLPDTDSMEDCVVVILFRKSVFN